MEADVQQLNFARKLASNELESRTAALKKLANFFASTDKDLSEDDLLKIWMGLFYAMWMSDKPTVQSELAKSIANLIHSFSNPNNGIMFIRTFYATMHKRFSSVDRLRYDKYLKLVRYFVNNSLAFLKKNNYDSELIDQFFSAMSFVWDREDSQEIQLHICDLFWDECYYACGSDIPSEAAFRFASFFADTLELTNHVILKTRLFEALKAFIAGASYCSPKLAPKRKSGMETNKELFPDVEFTNVNLEELVQWFMQRASTRKEILNRDTFYKLSDEALKKKQAVPGFKELPRGSIMRTVAEAEEQEYARLMAEHNKNKSEEEKKEEEEAKMGKKERKKRKKRKAAALKAAKENEENNKKEKIQKDQAMVNMNAVTIPGEKKGKKNKKQKKQKMDSVPATLAPAITQEIPKTTTTTVTTKKSKKNASGEVVGKSEEIVETKVTESANSKKTEVTTTITEVKKDKKELEPEKEVSKKKKKKKGKAQQAAAVVVEEKKPEEPPVTKKQKKAKPTPAPAPVEQEEQKTEESSSKKKQTEAKTTPTPPVSKPAPTLPVSKPAPTQTNGKASNKRKASEEDTEVGIPSRKSTEKKAKVSTPEANGNGNHKAEKGKKGKKVEKEIEEGGGEDHTPKKGAAVVTPPSTGKKSVRFSKNMEHVKEFDKAEVVATEPVAPSPSTTKLKGVLNTPPRKATPKSKKL